MIKKIISGGQTGVDQAALQAALELGIPYGGYCPKGRIDENGIIPQQFNQLEEIVGEFSNEKDNYDARTKLNIKSSDATIIIAPKIPVPETIKDGTLFSLSEAKKQNKPYLLVDLSLPEASNSTLIIEWINSNCIEILNIAGPRESNAMNINKSSLNLLKTALQELNLYEPDSFNTNYSLNALNN